MSVTKREKLIFPLFYFFAFLLDGQTTHLLRIFFGDNTSVKMYFIVLLMIYAVNYFPFKYLLSLTIIIGLLYDSYYYGVIGVYMVCFPLTLWLVETLTRVLSKSYFSTGVITLLAITFIELSSYSIRSVFQLTSETLTTFIASSLGPSLIINLLFVMIICFPFFLLSKRKNELK